MFELSNLVSVLSGGGFVALIGLVRWYLETRAIEKAKTFESGLQSITAIYNAMQRILNKTSAHRVCIIRVEDSGKIPRPGQELYSTIVHEVHDEKTPSAFERWSYQSVDAAYLETLIGVTEKRQVIVDADSLTSQALQNLYLSDKIMRGYKYFIYAEKERFFYLSMHFGEKKDLTAGEYDIIRAEINKIQKEFRLQRKKAHGFLRVR